MRVQFTILTLCLAGAASLGAQSSDPATDPVKIEEYVKTLPADKPPAFDEVQRLALAANPLGCEDHPHAAGGGGGGAGARAYLWQREGKPEIMEDYDKKRAFYGCLDWHSGANSMWMMVSLIKQDPTIPVAHQEGKYRR